MKRPKPPSSGTRLSLIPLVLFVAVLLSVAGSICWTLAGGRLLDMTTSSMCPRICVGSLVAVQPLHGAVHPGELLTFRPPGQQQVFTHRVIKVLEDGSFTTKGDLEGSPDPWTVSPAEVEGRVVFSVPGLGWWLQVLPLVAVGLAVLLMARRTFKAQASYAFDSLFCAAIVVIPLLRLRPLVNGQIIQTVADPHHTGWVRSLIVNTGLLPAHFSMTNGGAGATLHGGSVGVLRGPHTQFAVMMKEWVALSPWCWTILALVIASPLLACVLDILRGIVDGESDVTPVEEEVRPAPVAPDHPARRKAAPLTLSVGRRAAHARR